MSSAAELEADRARVIEIDSQLLDLNESMPLLQFERQTIQDRLDAYIYPVLTLPTEITSEIFIRFLPPKFIANASDTYLSNMEKHCPCHPQLWRAVHVVVTLETVEAQKDLIEAWLIRSGSHPLSIQMVDYAALLPATQRYLIQPVTRHRTRWEYLELTFNSIEILYFFCKAAPLLRHLEVLLDGIAIFAMPSIHVDGSPLLRSASLSYTALTQVTLPWQQLTSLTLNVAYPSECTRILQQTSSLLHCSISLIRGDAGKEPVVVLPCLETLVLDSVDSGQEVAGYLDKFVTPALWRLELEEYYLGSDPIVSLVSFISRSGCVLRELQILGKRPVHEDSFRSVFPSIPKLTVTEKL
ncbi:hypothetical protein C8R43DRAFT_952546 [Mycena crocata]|nr:hypothetical protein C8R43DRAFT_952546 [Mycena crocata]